MVEIFYYYYMKNKERSKILFRLAKVFFKGERSLILL